MKTTPNISQFMRSFVTENPQSTRADALQTFARKFPGADTKQGTLVASFYNEKSKLKTANRIAAEEARPKSRSWSVNLSTGDDFDSLTCDDWSEDGTDVIANLQRAAQFIKDLGGFKQASDAVAAVSKLQISSN